MVKLNRLFVLALVLVFVAPRLLTEEQPPAENAPVEGGEAPAEEKPAEQAPAEEKPVDQPAEKPAEEAKPAAEVAKPADAPKPDAKSGEKPPHKSKATFFIVIGIIVLGVGAIGAAHFLKNSQVSR